MSILFDKYQRTFYLSKWYSDNLKMSVDSSLAEIILHGDLLLHSQ